MNPYPGGQCTWGAAQMFPCLQNTGLYGNFGNGGDWFNHAQSIGLQTSATPVPGWLASFKTEGWPDGTGDVGLILSVNSDGTITRYGVNWHLDGQWSTDKVQQSLVIGSFKPPCTASSLPAAAAQLMSTSSSAGGNCQTFQWQLPLGVSLCFDSVIGMLSIGGGMLLMAAGIIVMIFGATGNAPNIQIQQPASAPQQPQTDQQPQQGTAPPFNPDAVTARARARAEARRRAVPVQSSRRTTGTISAASVAAKLRAGKSLTAAEAAYGNANQAAIGTELAKMAPA